MTAMFITKTFKLKAVERLFMSNPLNVHLAFPLLHVTHWLGISTSYKPTSEDPNYPF